MVLDPVCKMEVNPKATKWKSEYEGHTYRRRCQDRS